MSILTDSPLSGPLHGGANEAVIRMLLSIGRSVFIATIFFRLLTSLSSPKNVPAFLEAVKKRQKVLSGFGHRVYKTVRSHSPIVCCPDDFW